MIIDCISDLHGHYPQLEGGDLLIIAGDFSFSDTIYEYEELEQWLAFQPYDEIIVIAGNHDNHLVGEREAKHGLIKNVATYLEDSGTEYKGLKIWGSPWTLWFDGINPKCKAFTGSESDLKVKFDLIPDDTDILITHSPPYGKFDAIFDRKMKLFNTGSKSLEEAWMRVQPKLHVFGHIHEYGGCQVKVGDGYVVNASIMDECYDPINKPVRVIL